MKRRSLITAVLLAAAALYFPYVPAPISPGLDSSWMLGLSMAHVRGLVFGRDVIFSYGPLGYLLTPAFPETGNAAYLVFTFALFGTWLWAVGQMASLAGRKPAAALVCGWAIAGSVALMGLSPFAANTTRLESVAVVLALAAFLRAPGPAWPEWILLALWSGVAMLAKLNSGVEALLLLVAVLWPGKAPLGRKAAVLALAGFTTVVLYGASAHEVATLPAYLIHSYEITAGYAEAMVWGGTPRQLWLALAGLAGIFVLAPLLMPSRRTSWAGAPAALVVAYFAFKHAMIRQDEHVVPLFAELSFALLCLLAGAGGRSRRDVAILAVLPAVYFGVWLGVIQAVAPGSWPTLQAVWTAKLLVSNVQAHRHFTETRQQLERQTDAALQPLLAAPDEGQAMAGRRADMIPVDIDVVRANKWNWTPRPVFQSYSVYTPALDAINSTHLNSTAAAERIVYRRSQVDYRHEFVEDPRSWQTLLSWYDVLLLSGGDLVVQRRAAPRYGTEVDKGSQAVGWGQEFAVPQQADGGLLLLHATATRSLYGLLRTVLYRLEPMYIEVKRRSGARFSSRVIRANLVEGVPISAWPQSPPEWIREFGGIHDDPVEAVSFRNDAPWEYGTDIALTWSLLPNR